MKRESTGPILSTVFVDYDNIYLSLKRRNEDAAKRFAKDSGAWLNGLLTGALITPNTTAGANTERRIVMSRCYGNPVPRRNAHDNSTDMNSFPFIRHHFLRSGFEVIDCPPLTAQLKNSADIRIVMDVRDLLNHDTFFDEFIILSGDADFTPVLHRLRAHARRTVVFANDHTAQPYTALSDGEIRESSLIALLLQDSAISAAPAARELPAPVQQPKLDLTQVRKSIIEEVSNFVRSNPQAVPLETLADRAVRVLGRDLTVGTNWVGFGGFRDLLLADLPDDLHLSDTPPYTVFDANRHISSVGLIAPQAGTHDAEARNDDMVRRAPQFTAEAERQSTHPFQETAHAPSRHTHIPAAPPMAQRGLEAPRGRPLAANPVKDHEAPQRHIPAPTSATGNATQHPTLRSHDEPTLPRSARPNSAAAPQKSEQATQVQQSIARIHEACQAPALAPAEYRVLFDIMAQEIGANGLQGSQTLANLTQRAREYGLDLKRDDLRFILEVISESDPWFEQGATANLFSSRFRNFVVARCRSQGLSLSVEEIDLIEAWFSAQAPQPQRSANYSRDDRAAAQAQPAAAAPRQRAAAPPAARTGTDGDRWWSLEEGRQHVAEQHNHGGAAEDTEEDFPLIVRSRLRG